MDFVKTFLAGHHHNCRASATSGRKIGTPIAVHLLIVCLCAGSFGMAAQPPVHHIIPAPNSYRSLNETGGCLWKLTATLSLPDGIGENAMAAYSRWVQSREWTDEIWEDYGPVPGITGEYDPAIDNPEAYRLRVDAEGVTIYAAGSAGFFYGMQTLIQMIRENISGNTARLPACIIEDRPAFPWRGMHLDVARHYFSIDSIKGVIDQMAFYKLNTFHWHLTDDQGWRVDIETLPRLRTTAAWRDETLVGHYSEEPRRYDGRRHGGYYTAGEIRELVAYAAEREIRIVPEIEMPGHARAALAAYPQLSCTGDSLPVATSWGVFEDVFCTRQPTFDFLFTVLDELIPLFPGKYFHIGGDECPKTRWKNCPDCQANIRNFGLADEHELQAWFVGRMDSFLATRGKQLIGWDEILEGGLSGNAAVMAWRGASAAVEAARRGHEVVMCPTSHAYFDYYQAEGPGEPLAIGGFLPLEKVYAFDPVPAELSEKETGYILGAQGNLWTEYIADMDQLEYMAFPRIIAMAENVWTGSEKPGFRDFSRRLLRHFEYLDEGGVHYGTELLSPDLWVETDGRGLVFHAKKKTDAGALVYTTGNRDLTARSKRYQGPARLRGRGQVHCALLFEDGRLGPVKSLRFETGPESRAEVSGTPPHPAYEGIGLMTLTNGVAPPAHKHGGREWLAWWKESPTLEFAWKKPVRAGRIRLLFYESVGSWIYLPETLDLRVNGTGETLACRREKAEGNSWWYIFDLPPGTRLHHVELGMTPLREIPDGAQGAGQPAWIFLGQLKID